jgi:glutamine cyclotransferase
VGAGVLNGISISEHPDVLYITGKTWDRMFKIRLLGVSPKVASWLATPVTKGDGIKYEIVDQLVHDNNAFTEGLAYANGLLYESNGLNGESNIRTLDPATGEVVQSFPIDAKYFGEGLTYANGKFIQLTYKSMTGFIYDATDLTKEPETFTYSSTTNEGWGLTFDAGKQELVESDGSEYLHFWDPQTFQELRKVKVVHQDGKAVRRINELEWWRGRVLANVWYEDVILVIDPATGVVEKEYGKSPSIESVVVAVFDVCFCSCV